MIRLSTLDTFALSTTAGHRTLKRPLVAAAIAAFLAALLLTPSTARTHTPRYRGVLMVLIPTLALDEALQLPNTSRLIDEGSAALMSTRVGRPVELPLVDSSFDQLTSAYLTLASGGRAAGGTEAAQVFEANEDLGLLSAGEAWAARAGEPVPDSGIVVPSFELVLRQAQASPYLAQPGALAEILKDARIGCAVLGSSDTAESYYREAALLGVRPDGTGGYGALAGMTAKDARFPFGLRTDSRALSARLPAALARARFVVIETGDTARYARYEPELSEKARPIVRKRCLLMADEIVGGAASMLPAGWLLVIASPGFGAEQDSPGARLAPLIAYSPQGSSGLLSSGSTRRPGVLANTDVATGIAFWLGGNRRIGAGREVALQPDSDHIDKLREVVRSADFQAGARPAVYVLVYWAAAVLLVSTAALALPKASPKLAPILTLAPPAAALSFLPLSLARPGPWPLAAAAIGLGIIATLAATLVPGMRRAADGLSLTVIAVIAAALVTGFIPDAALSYEIQSGARYYGLGNEYGGLLIGAGGFLFLSRRETAAARWLSLAAMLLLSLGTGHPSLGANAGIMLGGLTGCAVYVSASSAGRGKRWVIPALVGAAAILILFAGLDSLRPAEEQSHFGKAINSLGSRGLGGIAEIAARKAALNLMLLQNSPWTLLLVASALIGLTPLVLRRLGRSAPPDLRVKCLWGAFAGLLLLNDSGVLAASACGLWLAAAAARSNQT